VLAWRRGSTGVLRQRQREGYERWEFRKRTKGDARVQFSLRLLESGYVRLVRPPVGPRDREPRGWPATQTRSLSLRLDPFAPLRVSIPLSRPVPFAIATHKSTCTTSRLVSTDRSLDSLSCFALCSLRDLRVINTIVAILFSSPALALSFKFHFSRFFLSLVQHETDNINRIPLLSALFSWRNTMLRDFTRRRLIYSDIQFTETRIYLRIHIVYGFSFFLFCHFNCDI